MARFPESIAGLSRKYAEEYKNDCEEKICTLEAIARAQKRSPNKDDSVIAHCRGMISIFKIRIATAEMSLALEDCDFDPAVLQLYEKQLAPIAALSCASAKNLQEAAAAAAKRGDRK